MIVNGASFIGRCITGTIASYTGVLNLTIISAVACSALIISMTALSDIANVIVIGAVYGYFLEFVCFAPPLLLISVTSAHDERIGVCIRVQSRSRWVYRCPAPTCSSRSRQFWTFARGQRSGCVLSRLGWPLLCAQISEIRLRINLLSKLTWRNASWSPLSLGLCRRWQFGT